MSMFVFGFLVNGNRSEVNRSSCGGGRSRGAVEDSDLIKDTSRPTN